VLLHENEYDAWLSSTPESAPAMFKTFPADELAAEEAPLRRAKLAKS
jgi:putative SOS response-associated peptidase YedK